MDGITSKIKELLNQTSDAIQKVTMKASIGNINNIASALNNIQEIYNYIDTIEQTQKKEDK
jgi:phage-related protein